MGQPDIPVLTEAEAITFSNSFSVPGVDVIHSSATPNARMKNVLRLIEQITGYATNVLLTGESGTGKEWVARYIHAASPRRDQSFVSVDCGAIPDDELESELFGHEKDAIEGAITSRKGRMEAAAGGTLFLNDVADISLPVQIKLARALEERSFSRIGGDRNLDCDFRLIAATQRDLVQAVGEETFHSELYYKLNVFPIEMPPLRERIDDLTGLVGNILKYCTESGLQAIDLTPGSVRVLTHYDWPGNIRELTDLIERL
jgi:sigma-54 specific flagellar transcriptional regulator A